MNISIGTKIRYLRKMKNLTQEELAKSLGTTKSAVGMWETDKRNPGTHMVHKMAELFNKDVSYFIRLEIEEENTIGDGLVAKTVDEFLENDDDKLDLVDFLSSIELSDNVNKKLTVDGKDLSDEEISVLIRELETAVEVIRIIRRK